MSARCPTACPRDTDTNEVWCARLRKWVMECPKVKGEAVELAFAVCKLMNAGAEQMRREGYAV